MRVKEQRFKVEEGARIVAKRAAAREANFKKDEMEAEAVRSRQIEEVGRIVAQVEQLEQEETMLGKELQGGHLEGDEMRNIAAKVIEVAKEKEKAEVAMRAPPAVVIIGDFQVVGGKKMRKVELVTRIKRGSRRNGRRASLRMLRK